MKEEFCTVKEIARMLKLKQQTIYLWIKNNKIPAYKIGKEYRIPKEQIFSWIYKNKVK